MNYDLKINGVVMPPPAKGGIKEAHQLIWSENAGRVANAEFVGDIIAEKDTLSITWNELTYAQLTLIRSNTSKVGRAFIDVSFVTTEGQRRVVRCYNDGVSGTIVTYTPDGRIADVTLNLIEK